MPLNLSRTLSLTLPLPLLPTLVMSMGALMAGCASAPPAASVAAVPPAERASVGTPTPGKPAGSAARPGRGAATAPAEVRTRNALFKRASFDELPGWRQDELQAGWGAFRNSCDVLQRREAWREICAASKSVPPNAEAIRAFFETHFAVLRILNTDNSRDGEVTGYFEPLLEGQRSASAEFNVPVMGAPTDLYTMDWARVPAAQRRSVVRVVTNGSLLMPAAPSAAGGYAMDMRRFTLDDRDRRLRVRLVGDGANARVEPYYTRAELDAIGLPNGIKAPVIAWVNDPLALYAMQVQGSGRIRLPDGSILRVQYAEQNGHPFRPLRVAAKAKPIVITRGANPAAQQADEFVLEGDTNELSAEGGEADPVVTRGGSAKPATAPAQAKPAPASDAVVDALLAGKTKRPAGPTAAPAKPATATTASTASKTTRLISDPSYVFFRTVPDRPLAEGPQGALGVSLTAGRSVAVDPRVTPMGYPLFLNAPAPTGSAIEMRRLVFAQDTGGAIRGALRADYFWGFGNEAGQKARNTRHRGQMWVLMPVAEANRLSASRIVTRGSAVGAEEAPGCLVDDGEFCTEAD